MANMTTLMTMASPSSSSTACASIDEPSVLERELNCSICTELLFDPVTFLNCLHTNCGACAKQWFDSQHQQLHGLVPSRPNYHLFAFTCPVCRKRVKKTRSNPIVVSLLEDLVKRFPEKARRSDDVAEMRAIYKPGDQVLPVIAYGTGSPSPLGDVGGSTRVQYAHASGSDRSSSSSPGSSSPGSPLPRRLRSPGMMNGVVMQRARARALTLESTLENVDDEHYHQPPPTPTRFNSPPRRSTSPMVHIQSAMSLVLSPHRRGTTLRIQSAPLEQTATRARSSASPRPPLVHLNPRQPPLVSDLGSDAEPSTALVVRHTRSPSAPPAPVTSLLSILQSSPQSPIILTCDACFVRIEDSVHFECSVCPMFHLCQRCHRTSQNCPFLHPLHRQKLTTSWPRRHLIAGVFCDVCDDWCDDDRNGTAKPMSMFWQCRSCNGGRWAYCMRCVASSWVCTHELVLWANNRTTSSPTPSIRRGGPPLPILRIATGGPSSTACLLGAGYSPWTFSPLANPTPTTYTCGLCTLPIPPTANTYIHCFAPSCNAANICTTCFYNRFRAFPCMRRALHAFLPCPIDGTNMAVLARPGQRVLHRGVFAHGPRPRPPEWINHSNNVIQGTNVPGGRRQGVANAVRGYWPEECDIDQSGTVGRKWGRGQWLCFPVGAEVLDVVVAFEVAAGAGGGQNERWCWGSYAGVGGLFPGSCVDFV